LFTSAKYLGCKFLAGFLNANDGSSLLWDLDDPYLAPGVSLEWLLEAACLRETLAVECLASLLSLW